MPSSTLSPATSSKRCHNMRTLGGDRKLRGQRVTCTILSFLYFIFILKGDCWRGNNKVFLLAVFTFSSFIPMFQNQIIAAQIATSLKKRARPNLWRKHLWLVRPQLSFIRPPLFVSCRGCGLQDSSLCADHRHRDRYPHDDLHRHWEIPRHRVPAENEEAVLAQKSIQDARYPIYTLKHTVTPS